MKSIKQPTTKEQARQVLSQKSTTELLQAYRATSVIENNILEADPEHILMMFYLEFELNHRGLPTRSTLNLGWD